MRNKLTKLEKAIVEAVTRDRVKVPLYLYHVTKAANTNAVLKNGLKASTGNLQTHEDTYSPRVYLAITEEDAENIRRQMYGLRGPQISSTFKIDTSKLRGYTYYDDPNFSGSGVYVEKDIPPEAITLIDDGRREYEEMAGEHYTEEKYEDLQQYMYKLISAGAPVKLIAYYLIDLNEIGDYLGKEKKEVKDFYSSK